MQFVEIYLPDGLSPESYSSYVVKSYLVRIKIMMYVDRGKPSFYN